MITMTLFGELGDSFIGLNILKNKIKKTSNSFIDIEKAIDKKILFT